MTPQGCSTHFVCKSPTGVVIGPTEPGGPWPCGHAGEVCCVHGCYEGNCYSYPQENSGVCLDCGPGTVVSGGSGPSDGYSCVECGVKASEPACESGAACAPGLVDVGGTCQPCSAVTISASSANVILPQANASTRSPPLLEITTTGPTAPLLVPFSVSPNVGVVVTLTGNGATLVDWQPTQELIPYEPGFYQAGFDNLLLSSVGQPSTYTASFAFGNGCTNVPPPVLVTMPQRDASTVAANCITPVTFGRNGNGPTPGPVTIVPVLLGWTNDTYAVELDAIYAQLAGSRYYAWIQSEYGAPALNTHPTVTVPSSYPSSLQQSTIDSSINSLVHNQAIPDVGNGVTNPLYMIHLAPGTVATTNNGKTLCAGILAWNSKTGLDIIQGGNRQYAVIPDPSTCGSNGGIDNTTVSITHELIENVTDPSSGQGWEDRTQPSACGIQIGDLCNREAQAIFTGVVNPVTGSNLLVVQKMWSNSMAACVTEDALNQAFE
jgi:hypothetical protein